MITTILRATWLELVRDRVALGLTFVLPILFFSIFASVFSAMDPGSLRPVQATLVAPDSGFAATVAERLAAEPRLTTDTVPFEDLEQALEAVRRGRTAAVVVLPAELAPSLGPAGPDAAAVEIHTDQSNPLAGGVVQGLVQSSVAAASLERLAPGFASGATVPVEVIDSLGRQGKKPSISFFAAGLGVMFLMFSVTGRGSILIEERRRGILGRLLAARIGLVRLLAARWLFFTGLGTVQVSLMFLWAAAVFGLELFTPHHLAGFALVTVITAAAASAFGLLIASFCRTRAQLSGVAVVVVLTLCALGGNMFPSFLMPEGLQAVGQLTFNAWALEAYQKVFWYERPLVELAPQLAALAAAGLVFFGAAVGVTRRWQLRGALVA